MYIGNVGLVLLTATLIIMPVSSEKDCLSQPVTVSFVLDRTVNINAEQWNQMSHFIQNVTVTLPEGSNVSCVYVNDVRDMIATFVVENRKYNLKDVLEPAGWKPSGHSVSAVALAQEVNDHFSASDFKKKAEVIFLLFSDLSTLSGVPPILLKKKIFVIVFGSNIPTAFQSLPSSGNHIHLIRDSDDVTRVKTLVSKQLCKDSFYKCDVDKYMERRSIICQTCMNLCSNIIGKQPLACNQRCPYIPIPPRQYAIKITDDRVHDGVRQKGTDSRKDTIVSVVLSISGFTFICLIIGLLFACFKTRLTCFARNGDRRWDATRHDSIAVPETVGPNEQVVQVWRLVPDEVLPVIVEAAENDVTERLMTPRDFLKNPEEEQLNILAFDDPSVIDTQTGHPHRISQ